MIDFSNPLLKSRVFRLIRSKPCNDLIRQVMNQPKNFKNFLKRRQEALSWLREHFPEAFSATNIQPLKVGIYHDIFAIKGSCGRSDKNERFKKYQIFSMSYKHV
ncbi:MAG: ProQ/FinO family protein, partial [Alphaproteobacteria bacterium]|nr:ProQ/FinO family protein [Alphaproteobacteria bacterium]